MELRKVLIADESEEFASSLMDMLRGDCLLRRCFNGVQAMEQLREWNPDLLVLDLVLPELDGISLLQEAGKEKVLPNVLALTRFVSPYVMDTVERLGVSYLMVKPCDLSAVATRIMDLVTRSAPPLISQPDCRNMISNLLIALRMPTKLRGYFCTREAVLYLMRDPNMSITKELYPEVAAMCNGTATQVERAIRGAITAAWNHRDHAIWPRYFPPDASGDISRPSNAAFLSRLANSLLEASADGGEYEEESLLVAN